MNFPRYNKAYGPDDGCALDIYMKNCNWTAKERCWVQKIIQFSRMSETIT